MSDILDQICNDKRAHVAARKESHPLKGVRAAAMEAAPPRGFSTSLKSAVVAGRYGLIAEIKRASPSQGLIRRDFDPRILAHAYEAGGACCLSVLTDTPYFKGTDADLNAAKSAVGLPVLRKDFMLDPYQIVESRALGADCVLLIMAALDDAGDDAEARELEAQAEDLGMDVLAEVHDGEELERALNLKTPLIGINNRNLKTLEVDLSVTETLIKDVPAGRLAVSESGLSGSADLARLAAAGAECFLVGSALMGEFDVEAATRALLSPPEAKSARA